MYSSRPLIDMNENPRWNKTHPWRPHYFLMELPTSSQFADSGSVLIICENRNLTHVVTKRTLFVLSVFAGFVLGLVLGSAVPLYLSRKQVVIPARSKETNVFNKSTNYQNSVNTSGHNLLQTSLVKGMFWSNRVEKSLPVGFGDEEDKQWKRFVQNNVIVRIEKGCGRMQNRLVTFEDGTKACCRYRQNTDQIQGEIYSYYLGRSLGLQNLVPSTLVMINSSDTLWMPVRAQLKSSEWLEEHPVVLTKFVEDLGPANIPTALRLFTDHILTSGKQWERFTQEINSLFKNVENTKKDIIKLADWVKDEKDAVEMAQWSDLIIFDYLTANLDRVVNNMYNLQWNPGMMSSPAHNLARVTASELLVFLDNESGLLHGYRLLDKYEPYHRLLLDGLCVFRQSTVEALSRLHPPDSTPAALHSLPPLPDNNVNILRQRVARVLRHVASCAHVT